MKFFNTLTRKKEFFKPIKEGEVGMYSCGPTVYSYAHLGNLRAFVFVDILKKYLKYSGFKVKHVMNITDVDDKTIKGAKKAKKSLKDFTRHYEKEFLEDLKTLNIEKADIMPRATEHIKDMVDMIEKLDEKNITYKKKDSIYYAINKFQGYGRLAKLDAENLKKNADGRIQDADEYDKENPRDFALWKAYTKDDGKVFWKHKLGKGRPGWHIECSAMSTRYLGETFDIHTGGVDLIFPHHTNEIAQTEGATGKKFVNYWLHNAHLIVNGEKMSKSMRNFFTLRDLLKKGHDPKAIRYELISTHYRQRLDFREKNLKNVESTIQRIREIFLKLNNIKENVENPEVNDIIDKAKQEFGDAMDDDLNIAKALSKVFSFIREINSIIEKIGKDDAQAVKETLEQFDSVLGIMDFKEEKIPKDVKHLAEKRLKARNEQKWREADSLRAKIKKKGYHLDDTSDGYILKKI